MAKSPGGFRAALLIGWVALGAAGLLYARAKDIPGYAALPVVAAFLFLYPFYLLPGFPLVRNRISASRLPAILLALNVLPYLICCLGPVTFQWTGLLRLAALAVALGLWYLVFPATPLSDAGFLALVVGTSLGRYFDPIYQTPVRLYAAELGRAGLFITAALVLMIQRRIRETGYGFLPNRKEWRIGAIHYLYFLAVGLPIALVVQAVHFGRHAPLWLAAATFIGFLWGLALAEEFLFRGVLQQWIEDWTASRMAALLLASTLFGAAHLWYRGFPNWKMALLAGLNGLFCGLARNRAGSIRASVVTHTLVVTTWRTFLT